MHTDDIEIQRKRFEIWAKSKGMYIEKSRGKYRWDNTMLAWKGWMAALGVDV